MHPTDEQILDRALRALPRDEFLAFANSVFAIISAQISSGKKLKPRELEIFNKGYELLRRQRDREASAD